MRPIMTPDDFNKPVSVGPVLPGTEARVVDVTTGKSLEPGWWGELHVRGLQVMRAYWGETDGAEPIIDDEGWLHTGDVAYADADGHFFLLGRVDELINCLGIKVPPAQLEAVLCSHPAVADAAVVGVPNDAGGEVPKAYLVLKNQAVPVEDIVAFAGERLAPYKQIRAWTVVAHIPRSASGRILRRQLLALH